MLAMAAAIPTPGNCNFALHIELQGDGLSSNSQSALVEDGILHICYLTPTRVDKRFRGYPEKYLTQKHAAGVAFTIHQIAYLTLVASTCDK